ncbi:MAG: SHOCT domain-containing protein [Candidatus Cloacimonetes bacterium]|nr:SHOCT domain-containing protein [Candidatus Cloacimonadota bacterium]MBS3767310.1 SHOCT domain-containing protein [Candidatus Cloacimonadota bacterium]
MYHTYGPFGWGMGFTWLIGVILLIAIIWIAIKAMKQTGATGKSEKTALDILEERYAKGEIDKQEFEERKETLTKS